MGLTCYVDGLKPLQSAWCMAHSVENPKSPVFYALLFALCPLQELDGQLNHEFRTPGCVILYVNHPVVIRYNSVYNRKPKPHSGFFC